MKNKFLKEVYPGIFSIKEKGVIGIFKPPVNIYVITGKNGLVFDAGYGDRGSVRRFSKAYKEIIGICKERGVENNIDRILLSHAHADHFSGLKKLRSKWGFRILVTGEMNRIIKSSRDYRDSYEMNNRRKKIPPAGVLFYLFKTFLQELEFTVYALSWGLSFVPDPDIIIEQDSKIDINGREWYLFNSPGHSSDHIILYDKNNGILFSGDNVMKSINVWLGPPKSDLEQYEASLIKMMNLNNLKIILPAHGGPVTRTYERLNEIIEWRKKRTDDVLSLLIKSKPDGFSLREIIDRLYPSDNRFKKNFAEGWIELTLQKLEREKIIFHNGDKYFYQTR